MTDSQAAWLALVIGNTRLHWAAFLDQALQDTWHTPHLTSAQATQLQQALWTPEVWAALTETVPDLPQVAHEQAPPPLYLASVVPDQTAHWQDYAGLYEMGLHHIPLGNLYPTLGIDRALNLLAAGDRYGWPVLVVDAGTALTFTAGDYGALRGGAILPGLAMQAAALDRETGALPATALDGAWPPRWANHTAEAIRSGILHGQLATIHDFLTDWWNQYPGAAVVLTGGDSELWWQTLRDRAPLVPLHHEPLLMFWGIQRCRQAVQPR